MATGTITKDLKYVDLTMACEANTWQSLSLPSGVDGTKVLSIQTLNISTDNGYWLLWNVDTVNRQTIRFLRLGTSNTNVIIINAASNINLRVYYTV